MKAAFAAFDAQWQSQELYSGPPSSEHAIHLLFALGLVRANLALPGEIVFERRLDDRRRVDIWLRDEDIGIEVKFIRPIPSGRNLPNTQHLGGLLADFNKLARAKFTERLVILVTHTPHFRYLERNAVSVIPLGIGAECVIDLQRIAQLPQTARVAAVSDGDWQPLKVRLRASTWHDDKWAVLGWQVEPLQTPDTEG